MQFIGSSAFGIATDNWRLGIYAGVLSGCLQLVFISLLSTEP